jgi:hypothetical protein
MIPENESFLDKVTRLSNEAKELSENEKVTDGELLDAVTNSLMELRKDLDEVQLLDEQLKAGE